MTTSEINWEFIHSLESHLRESLEGFVEVHGDVSPAELSVACSILIHRLLSNVGEARLDREARGDPDE